MLNKVLRTSLVLLFALSTQSVSAQTGTIEGTVRDSLSSETLPGANLYIDQLGVGAATGQDGGFTIEGVPAGRHLISVTFVGYTSKEIPVEVESGATTTVEILLSSQAMGLQDLVVTALGVEREERALGYASQAVSSDEVSQGEETNFVNSLQGKIAGAEITNSTGGVGSSSKILLRGASSLSGDNQPLIIVDGVAIDNSSFEMAGPIGWDDTEIDYGNGAMDLNPDDIASINVLKGPNAAALYGSRAANGAIIITTKDGSAGDGIEVQVSSDIQTQGIAMMPDYQNEFGHGQIDPNGVPRFEWVDGRGGGTFDAVGESWGPRLNQGTNLPQWYSNGEPVPWVSNPGNTESFFNQGAKIANSVAISGSFDRSNFRVSAKNLQHTGMVPNSRLHRTNVSIAAGAQFTDRLAADGKITYIKTNAHNRPERGYTWNNVMFTIGQWTARQINMDRLMEYKDADGNMRNWNMIHENPYWIQYENTNSQWKDRIIGNVSLKYTFADWLTGEVFTGTDWYEDRREEVYSVGSNRSPDGEYREAIRYVNEWNSRAMLRADTRLYSDFSLNGIVGLENRQNRYNLNSGYTSGLSVPGLYTLQNAKIRPELEDYTSQREVNSVYTQASIGFRDYLYLDLTGRNDWSSTLPPGNNSYFYPSVSMSFVFSDVLDDLVDWGWFSYGKIRGGWTRVGNDTDPYQLAAVFNSLQPFGDTPLYDISTVVPNSELKPERTESWEIGGDIRVLQSRIRLNVTYYNSITTDQIVPIQVSRATGATERVSNVGQISNQGIETSLSATTIDAENLTWDVTLNFSRNRNRVDRLTAGLDSYVLGGRGVSVEARPGDEFGALYGTGFQRDDEGNIVVDDRGIPIRDDEIRSFGSYSPEWSGSIHNNLSYRNLNLSFLIDTKQGGVLFLDSQRWGHFAGTYIETLKGRMGDWIYQGEDNAAMAVKQDGSPNDIPITMQTVQDFWRQMSTIDERYVYDASYVKLREVSLTYRLPTSWLENVPIEDVGVSALGRNLWIIHKNAPHIDPETTLNTGNVSGIESNQIPPARTFGFKTTVTF
jgi:TonB-linked SusC/RagA family outer membrane protein